MTDTLLIEARDAIIQTLTEEQQIFLMEHVKRGKRTAFANELAKRKGTFTHGHVTGGEIAPLIDDWLLEDIHDAGPGWRDVPEDEKQRCECGMPLRYQYVVTHRATGQVRHFGETHFQLHTGIPSEIVKAVLKGMQKIDYELDELLIKVRDGWTWPEWVSAIFEQAEWPPDVAQHHALGLPLLEKQLQKLNQMADEKAYQLQIEKRKKTFRPRPPVPNASTYARPVHTSSRAGSKSDYSLSKDLHPMVQRYIKEGVQSALDIAELLIKHHGANHERFPSSGRPIFYGELCVYIESLPGVEVISTKGNDRTYRYSSPS